MNSFIVLSFCLSAILMVAQAGQYGSGTKLRVATVLSPSYAVQGPDGTLSGFIVDLLQAVSAVAGFTYDISIAPDYGTAPLPNGTFGNAVGMLIAGEVDVIACDMSVNSLVDSNVDFSLPYFTTQIRIMKRVDDTNPDNAVKYTVHDDAGVRAFFATTQIPLFKTVQANLLANGGFVPSVQEGVNKVLGGGGWRYVEDADTVAPYLRANPGVLMLIPGNTFTEHYAFAVQQDSPLRDMLSIAVSKINESGKLLELITKWGLDVTSC